MHTLQRTCLCAASPWLQQRGAPKLSFSHTRCKGVFMNTMHDGSGNLSSLLCVGSCLGPPTRPRQAHTAACVCVSYGGHVCGLGSVAARPHPLLHTFCSTHKPHTHIATAACNYSNLIHCRATSTAASTAHIPTYYHCHYYRHTLSKQPPPIHIAATQTHYGSHSYTHSLPQPWLR
jgi:hypothetical protein